MVIVLVRVLQRNKTNRREGGREVEKAGRERDIIIRTWLMPSWRLAKTQNL